MPIEIPGSPQTYFSSIAAQAGQGLTTSDQIGHGEYSNSNQTIDSVHEVVERKLEASGVLVNQSGTPVFANETALLYFDTATSKLYVRGSTSYEEINNGAEESEIIGHNNADPDSSPDETDPWIYIRTDQNKVWLKERTGSPGSYSYAWTGPIFEGVYKTDIVYSSEDTPSNLNVTWNWRTGQLDATGTGWSRNEGTAKWARILIGVPNTVNAIISADLPVGSVGFEDNVIIGIGTTTPTFNSAHSTTNPLIFYNTTTAELFLKTRSEYRQVLSNAGDVGYMRRNTDTVLAASVDNVQDAVDALSDQIAILLARPSGGAGTDDQTAAEVPTSTTNFNQNLSAADSNVQLALDTIDNLDVPPYYEERFRHQNNRLTALNATYTQNFSIPQRVRDYRDRKDIPLSIVANSHVEVAVTTGQNEYVQFTYEVLDSMGNSLTPRIFGTSPRLNAGNQVERYDINITGILPDTLNNGRLRTIVTVISTVPPAAGVQYDEVQIVPDPSGVDASGFNGNLETTDNTLQKVAQKFDDYTSGGATAITASGFDGNLATTDDTIQKVAQKFDDYIPTATQTTVRSADFSDPNNFIGGLNENTGISGVPPTPMNVQQALVKTDYLLQAVYNPYQSTQLMDQDTAGVFTRDFTINTTSPPGTPTYSNPIDIPQEVRDLGVPVAVRTRIKVSSMGTNWVGDISLVDPDNRATVYGDLESVTDTVYDNDDWVTFQRIIAANAVPDTVEVRFRRTGGTTSTTFNDGLVDVIDITSASTGMMGAGGQSAGYTSTIIWLAGATIQDRIAVASETTNYDLMAGHNFSDYDQLVFVFDGGAGSTQPLIGCWIDSNLFQAFGAAGTLWIVGNWWLMVSRQDDNTFRWRWRAPSNGLRRIIGIST